jgi:SAM-dependent methyltransferase
VAVSAATRREALSSVRDVVDITTTSEGLLLKIRMTEDLGFAFNPASVIMDFGCGSGSRVHELRQLGYQAFGCDLKFKNDKNIDTASMQRRGILRLIDKRQYALPFNDNTFDLIFSDQVFEHVQDYPRAVSELARVLKPDGMCLHIFPSRYAPIEPHVYVPLASIIQSYWWLYCWALLGIRNEEQRGAAASKTATDNLNYLKNNTNYLSRRTISRQFFAHFHSVIFCENTFLKYSRKGKYLWALSHLLPFIPSIYSAFRGRVISAKQPIKIK